MTIVDLHESCSLVGLYVPPHDTQKPALDEHWVVGRLSGDTSIAVQHTRQAARLAVQIAVEGLAVK